MLNHVKAVFKGSLSENNILFGHAVDSPDSLLVSPHWNRRQNASVQQKTTVFFSFSSTNISIMWPLTAYSQCLCYIWEIPGRGPSEAFRL